jgi:hypothetical protein
MRYAVQTQYHHIIADRVDAGGHADTRMVERHYGHLAPSFITEAIHAGAPRYGVKPSKRVVRCARPGSGGEPGITSHGWPGQPN